MKQNIVRILTLTGLCALGSTGLSAQTVVGETADGDLRVVDYRGKPPFTRKTVSAEDSADFARFEAINDTVLVATGSSRRAGPPGKSIGTTRASFERVNEADISQFARFEESDAGNTRMWRGAPGKGRPRLGN